jgi:hypothetical protein
LSKHDIPAPGFVKTTGERNPRDMGQKYFVQYRCGWVDWHGPYQVRGVRWVHDGSAWDIVAVRKA